jgi:hypothetical protein
MNVRKGEFPVLVRLVNTFEESLSLLFLRQVKKEFDDPGAVAIKMALQIHDGTIPLLPDGFLVEQSLQEAPGRAEFPDARERRVPPRNRND